MSTRIRRIFRIARNILVGFLSFVIPRCNCIPHDIFQIRRGVYVLPNMAIARGVGMRVVCQFAVVSPFLGLIGEFIIPRHL